jgi:hypothetical protein
MDKSCLCRPVPVQPVSGSATFLQVSETDYDPESMLSESYPRWSSKIPIIFTCSLIGLPGLGWITGIALPSLLPSDL